jgi:hypothetical protein
MRPEPQKQLEPTRRKRVEPTNREIERFIEKYPHLRQEDVYFSSCAIPELNLCFQHEYASHSPHAVETIMEWRGAVDSLYSAPPEKLDIAMLNSLGITLDRLKQPKCGKKISRPMITEPGSFNYYLLMAQPPTNISSVIPFPGCFCALYPEWPYVPYLGIGEDERKQRLNLLSLTLQQSNEALVAQIMPRKPSGAFHDLIYDCSREQKTVVRAQYDFDSSTMTKKEMLRRVAMHLEILFPGKDKPNMRIRSLRSLLTALAAHRCLQAVGHRNKRILHLTGRRYADLPSFYADPSAWSRGNALANKFIAGIDAFFFSLSKSFRQEHTASVVSPD